MKKLRLFYYYLFASLFMLTIVAKELYIYEGSELFENQLFVFLYQNIDKELLKTVKFSDLTNQKSTSLNFRDAILLYLFSMQHHRYRKYTIWALERIYALSSDAQLNELVLWNLAFHYEKKDNFIVAGGLYSAFKKMFPGSLFYWEARYKEILMNYKHCREAYHDTGDIDRTMVLCEEYISDVTEVKSDFSFKIIDIYQDLSLRIIKKNLGIIAFYENKYSYSREVSTFFSCVQRLENILKKIDHFLSFAFEEITHKKNQIYSLSLREIEKLINQFFVSYSIETLPAGKQFIEEYRDVQEKIKKNKSCFMKDIEEIYRKINNFVDAYYEL